jgi:hypothetical protein
MAHHGLAGAYFCSFAALRLTVHRHRTIGNHVLALPAALGNARKFEQIAKPDMPVF